MKVMLAPTLEIDLGDMVISLGDIHKFLMGMDIMSGLQGVLIPSKIRFPGVRVMGHVY